MQSFFTCRCVNSQRQDCLRRSSPCEEGPAFPRSLPKATDRRRSPGAPQAPRAARLPWTAPQVRGTRSTCGRESGEGSRGPASNSHVLRDLQELSPIKTVHPQILLGTLTIKALQALSRTPRRYMTSTALEAFAQTHQAVMRISPTELARRYPGAGSADAALTDMFRLEAKRVILSAWKRRRSVASETVCPLSCYSEEKPYEDRRGLLKLDPKGCKNDVECGLSAALKADLGIIERLHQAVKLLPESPEIVRRRKALREIERKPRSPLGEGVCEALGDAVFAILAPPGSVILTTNLKDHAPLAAALGKSAEAPK